MTQGATSLAFVADVHCHNFARWGGVLDRGINRRCRDVLTSLDDAAYLAKDHGCSHLVVLGDLFDNETPEPQVITAMQKVLSSTIPTIVVKGNHESVSSTPGDHALGPLEPVAHVVDQPTLIPFGNLDLICLPFFPGRPETWLDEMLRDSDRQSPNGILAVHMGVYDSGTDEFLRTADDAIQASVLAELCAKHNIQQVFAGNWHWPQVWEMDGVKITQVGTLAPSRFTDEGTNHGNVVVLENGETYRFQVPGPRFLKFDNLDDLKKITPLVMPTYVRAEVPAEELSEARLFLQSLGWPRGWEVVSNRKATQKAATVAAKSAHAAPGLENAVRKFVRNMPLEDGVDRGTVEALSLEALR